MLAELSGSTPTASYIRNLSIDEPFVRKQASGDEFYQTDALGTTIDLTDTNGAPQTTYTYESFGNVSVAGTSVNKFQYTGRENDGTGAYYYRARYYNPRTQRFLSEDPFAGSVLVPDALNKYPYVFNDPVYFRDPSGLSPTIFAGAGVGALFGGVGALTGVLSRGVTDPLAIAGIVGVGAVLGPGSKPPVAGRTPAARHSDPLEGARQRSRNPAR